MGWSNTLPLPHPHTPGIITYIYIYIYTYITNTNRTHLCNILFFYINYFILWFAPYMCVLCALGLLVPLTRCISKKTCFVHFWWFGRVLQKHSGQPSCKTLLSSCFFLLFFLLRDLSYKWLISQLRFSRFFNVTKWVITQITLKIISWLITRLRCLYLKYNFSKIIFQLQTVSQSLRQLITLVRQVITIVIT